MFQNVHTVVVHNSQLSTTENNFDRDAVSTTLWQHVAAGAMFDSSELYPLPKCHPGTRQKMIDQITAWINDADAAERILWLYGPAGAGKSALMQSLCEHLRNSHPEMYAGSFFFGKGAKDGTKLFVTLSYQLAVQFPSVRAEINNVLNHDPSLSTKSIETQLLSLIINPLSRCKDFTHTPTIIIDGLDECGDNNQGADTQLQIITLISKSIVKYNVSLRFIVASRPQYWIRDTFDTSPLLNITRALSLRDDIDADKDIRAYLTEEFEKIRLDHLQIMRSVKTPWPPKNIVDYFVQQASGQYLYASTVLKFVGRFSRFVDPQKQLHIITTPGTHRASVFSELDRLYATILSVYPNWEAMRLVLGGLLVGTNVTVIEVMLGVESTEITIILNTLSSLIDTFPPKPLSENDLHGEPIFGSLLVRHERIKFCYLSFHEFLQDESRSGTYYINVDAIKAEITQALFRIIRRNLDQNYETEPHVLLNISPSTYNSMMRDVFANVNCDVETLLPLIMDMRKTLLFLNPDRPLNHPSCFIQDMELINNMACEIERRYDERETDSFLEAIRELRDLSVASLPRGSGVRLSPDAGLGSTEISSSTLSKPRSSPRDEVGNDYSQHFDTLNVWIAAEHALQHLNQHRIQITQEFSKHDIESSQYAIYAGFDESLLQAGIGYLQQIHVFTSASVLATSPLLSSLGKIFSPFSSILFAPSSKYSLSVYKPDGSCWEFDELVFETAAKLADRGSTAAMHPTVISLAQTVEGSSNASPSGQSVQTENGKDQKGKRRDTSDKDGDEETNEDKNGDGPGGDPDSDPPNNSSEPRPAEPTRVSFSVVSEVYSAKSQNGTPRTFQFLSVEGTLTIHDAPLTTTGVEFTRLKFGSSPTTTDTAYQQNHLRVTVDSRYKANFVTVHKPQRTPAFDRENKVISGTKTNWTVGGSIGATLGLTRSTHATLAGTATRATEHAAGLEKKGYTSRITQQNLYGVVWWGFEVDDPHEREAGIDLSEDTLPSVTFEFPHSASSGNPSKPGRVDVEVASYWSIIPGRTQELGWLKSLLSHTSGDVSYSNLCQILVLSIPRHTAQNSFYNATVQVANRPQSLQSNIKVHEKTGEVEVFPTLTRRIGNASIEYGNLERECSLELSSIRLARPGSIITAQPKPIEEKGSISTGVSGRETEQPVPDPENPSPSDSQV